MRLTKTLAFAVSALALSTGAAFAGGDAMAPQDQQEFLSEAPLSHQSDPMGYQPYLSYEQGGPAIGSEPELLTEYEVYDVYLVPAEEIVLVPLEQPSEVPISANELG